MDTNSAEQTSTRPASLEEYVEQRGMVVLDRYARLLLDQLAKNLKEKLTQTQFSKAARDKYIFLDRPTLADDIMSAVYLSQVQDSVTVVVGAKLLEDRGLPANVLDILEYGDAFVPALFALRKTVSEVLKKRIEEVMKP